MFSIYYYWLLALSVHFDRIGIGNTAKGITLDTLKNLDSTIQAFFKQLEIANIFVCPQWKSNWNHFMQRTQRNKSTLG